MKMFSAILLLILATCHGHAQVPDGTVILSSKKGLIGRIAQRVTGGDQYTHAAIVLDGYVYESDWPRAKRTPVNQYGKWRSTNDFYVPSQPLSRGQVSAMRSKAQSMLGTRYDLRNYFRPGSARNAGTWCSPYVGKVLGAGGVTLSSHQMHEPQNLKQAIGHRYRFARRTLR
ncbi:MAG: hypothetical protein AAGJ40_02785 [Planctomycetota bacterium]